MKHKLKVGDIVDFCYDKNGKTYRGKIGAIYSNGQIRVAFGADFDGWNWKGFQNCWLCKKDELVLVQREDEEKIMKHKLKVGDIVSFDYVDSKTYRGKVIELDSPKVIKGAVTVSFGADFHGWSEGIYGHCWYCDESELKLVFREEKPMDKSKEIKIIVNEPAVIAIRGDKKGIAKCNPADTFDVAIGSKLAIERLIEAENGHWVPSNGEKYFMVCEPLHMVSNRWGFTPSVSMNDNVNLALGNMFKTPEEAEAHKEEIKKRFDMMIKFAEGLPKGDK